MHNFYVFLLWCLPLSIFPQVEWPQQDNSNHPLDIERNYPAPKDNYDGSWEFYYKNGEIQAIGNYIYGKLNGDFKSYYKNGQVKSEGHYKNNKRKGFWRFYYENGQIKKKGNYRYGKLRGLFQSYYQNGQLKSEGNFIDIEEKKGLWKFYYENGQLKEEHIYQNRTLISKKWFDEDGNSPFESTQKRFSKYNPLLRPMSWTK